MYVGGRARETENRRVVVKRVVGGGPRDKELCFFVDFPRCYYYAYYVFMIRLYSLSLQYIVHYSRVRCIYVNIFTSCA